MIRQATRVWVPVLVVLATACTNPPSECLDLDFDGFGIGCPLGDDCDDRNADRTNNCDRVPPPDCVLDPTVTGCPCVNGQTSSCYPAPLETQNVGMCRAGTAVCRNMVWGACEGAVLPHFEYCNFVDDDCDGVEDDGVRSPCGGCDSSCQGSVWGEADAMFVPGEGLAVTSEEWLTLARAATAHSVLWVANSADGTVSKIDANSAVEVARYATGGADPSRVAVDYNGDAWIANRAFGGQGSIIKIAGSAERCVDRNADGVVTSQSGLNVLPFGEDECVLFQVPVGELNAVPRALAIDGSFGLDGASGGNAWVGLHEAERLIVIDGQSGTVVRDIPMLGIKPYGAVIDAWGALWMMERDGRLLTLDTTSDAPTPLVVEVPLPCYLLYSIDSDRDGRLVMTGFNCDDVVMHQPATGVWAVVSAHESPRGVAVASDGLAWVSHTDGTLSRLSLSPLRIEAISSLATETSAPFESIGVAVDDLGNAWIASEHDAINPDGVVTRVDRSSMAVTASVPVGEMPHTQGDLTGSSLRGAFVPEARTSHVFTGCDAGGTAWINLHIEARLPSASEVLVALRHAATADALSSLAFEPLATITNPRSVYPLAVPSGDVVEVELTLRTRSRVGAPRVVRVGVEWQCPGPL